MQVYRARKPRASPLWQCIFEHFDAFLDVYEERYRPRYGFLRSVIPEVVHKFLDCGDLEHGFARVRCDHCRHEYLLAETILYPVPHRHYTLGIPRMLRPYFRFGEYLDFHPHLHALVADGLFTRSCLFYVMPNVSLKPLEKLFRARVIVFLVEKGLLSAERAQMLRGWQHSGFNMHHSRRILPHERRDLEQMAQYIIRNPFSVEKMQVNRQAHSIIYRSAMNEKIKRNFEVFSPTDFIAAITQHIPDKSFQLVRYCGWYSNKMRGQRDKRAAEDAHAAEAKSVEVIDVSECQPRRIPSPKWRELIKKVWEADPLLCPKCQREMRIVSLINERDVIERILRHVGLWEQSVWVRPARDPPETIEPWLACPPEPWRRRDDPFPDYDHEPVLMCANG